MIRNLNDAYMLAGNAFDCLETTLPSASAFSEHPAAPPPLWPRSPFRGNVADVKASITSIDAALNRIEQDRIDLAQRLTRLEKALKR